MDFPRCLYDCSPHFPFSIIIPLLLPNATLDTDAFIVDFDYDIIEDFFVKEFDEMYVVAGMDLKSTIDTNLMRKKSTRWYYADFNDGELFVNCNNNLGDLAQTRFDNFMENWARLSRELVDVR